MSRRQASKPDVWTLFPVAALISFAGWVVHMAANDDPMAVMLCVTLFLAAVWKLCRRYHEIRRNIDNASAGRRLREDLSERGPR
ncbi:hypothetical protein [Nonomuraea typhae]|uniref:hypothetical protein n=1 Tax=Nonomuraea typhae TaxID=2603600 RepID=UPI0012FAF211|nr:hypothetical protein [Nonomuraea typhae]